MDPSDVSISSALKSVIRSGHKAPEPPCQRKTQDCFRDIHQDVLAKGVREEVYLVILTGLLFSLNIPSAISCLYHYAVTNLPNGRDKVYVAAFMREIGLKTISFVGVPKVINCLAVLHKAISEDESVSNALPSRPRRTLDSSNIEDVHRRGKALWDEIYTPHHDKLLSILGESHPDLPIHILQSHYSALLAPLPPPQRQPTDLDRELISVLAVVSLRAQPGVEKQVESHVFGLRKAHLGFEGREGSWVSSEQGCHWLLVTVDRVVEKLTM